MKINLVMKFVIFIMTICLITSCSKEFEEINNESLNNNNNNNKTKAGRFGNAILEISFDIKTSHDFIAIPNDLSSLDLSQLNPGNEKQHVHMQLFKNGQINLTIEE